MQAPRRCVRITAISKPARIRQPLCGASVGRARRFRSCDSVHTPGGFGRRGLIFHGHLLPPSLRLPCPDGIRNAQILCDRERRAREGTVLKDAGLSKASVYGPVGRTGAAP